MAPFSLFVTVYMTLTMGSMTVVSCKADTAFCLSYMRSLSFFGEVEIILFLLQFRGVLVDCRFDYIYLLICLFFI